MKTCFSIPAVPWNSHSNDRWTLSVLSHGASHGKHAGCHGYGVWVKMSGLKVYILNVKDNISIKFDLF